MEPSLRERWTGFRHHQWGCGGSSPALRDARRLQRAGRHRDAIELLSREFEASGDAAVACQLIRLRCDAAQHVVAPPTPDSWPPSVARRFADVEHTPAIAPSELSAEVLASAIVHNGGLIVRGLFNKPDVERLRSCVSAAFDARDRFLAGRPAPEDSKWYHRFDADRRYRTLHGDRHFVEIAGGVLGADSPGAVHEVLKRAESHGVVALAEKFLGERPAVSVMKTTLRIVPPTTNTGWHQDGAFLGSYVRSVNMWIALSECGDDAPSLDIIPKRFDEILPTGVEGAHFDWSVSEIVAERAASQAGVPIEHLHFEPGDTIFFDHMNLHRTGVRPGMTKDRLAIEWWFFAPSHFPRQQIQILA